MRTDRGVGDQPRSLESGLITRTEDNLNNPASSVLPVVHVVVWVTWVSTFWALLLWLLLTIFNLNEILSREPVFFSEERGKSLNLPYSLPPCLANSLGLKQFSVRKVGQNDLEKLNWVLVGPSELFHQHQATTRVPFVNQHKKWLSPVGNCLFTDTSVLVKKRSFHGS